MIWKVLEELHDAIKKSFWDWILSSLLILEVEHINISYIFIFFIFKEYEFDWYILLLFAIPYNIFQIYLISLSHIEYITDKKWNRDLRNLASYKNLHSLPFSFTIWNLHDNLLKKESILSQQTSLIYFFNFWFLRMGDKNVYLLIGKGL